MTDVTGVAIRTPRPPWLPLWGSCHEVTERVNSPSPPLRGTSPIGRGKTLVRLALPGDARASSLYTREPLGAPTPAHLPFSTIFLCGQIHFGGRCRRGQTVLRKGEAEPLKKSACFLRGLPLTPVRRRGRRRQNTDPDLQGKALRSFNIRAVRGGDSGGFRIFGRYPNWAFRDSGHFCPRKIPLRPLLLFETGRIQTATVAQLGQE